MRMISSNSSVLVSCGVLLVILGSLLLWQVSLLNQCRDRLDLAFAFRASQIEDLSSLEVDAPSRWAEKNDIDSERALRGRRAFSASKDDEVCVVLALEPGAFGTSPIYCYDRQGDLVSEYSEAG